MDERNTRDPLRDLGRRLDQAQRARRGAALPPAAAGTGDARSALGLAFRIGLELVVAVAVGVAIGWALDRWFGTRPWGVIVFLFLGVGAGMLNVYRAVTGLGRAVGYRREDQRSAGAPGGKEWADDED